MILLRVSKKLLFHLRKISWFFRLRGVLSQFSPGARDTITVQRFSQDFYSACDKKLKTG